MIEFLLFIVVIITAIVVTVGGFKLIDWLIDDD